MIGAADELPRRPRRVIVAGSSGSGKTTLAARIGAVLDVPHVEIDALFHGPAWTPRPSFMAGVEAFSAQPAWVTEWQYPAARDVLAERADLLVWLDLRRATVMGQVVWRTLRRRLRRQVLWNGNVEPPLRSVLSNPEHIVRWAWSTHHETAPRVAEVRLRHPELVVVGLRDRREAQRWIDGPLRRAASSGR